MVIGGIIILFVLLTLYCCVVQGKKADEVIDRLYREAKKNK